MAGILALKEAVLTFPLAEVSLWVAGDKMPGLSEARREMGRSWRWFGCSAVRTSGNDKSPGGLVRGF